MLKTPSSTVIGGAGIWTPSAWKIGLDVLNLGQLIRNLFSQSEIGFAYDPNDLTTLYQDAAGTIPVTAAGQPVGLVKDKSGRNNHAYQTTPSMRPLLQNSPRKIDYDGVDDELTVNPPAQLTGCTVVRAVPGVGTQILTNQTIATPYNDSTDHCGLIAINRALTQTETAQITQIFNRLAGV